MKAAFTNRYDTAGFLKPNIKSSLPGGWQQIILSDNNKAEDLIVKLKKEKGVINAYIERPIPIKPCIAPTDPLYSTQWHLNSVSSPLSDINAEQAWDINRGRSDVIIAVCDGGVDYTHSDLDPGDRSRVILGYDSGNDDNDPMDDLQDVTGSFGGHGTHIAGIIGAIPNNGQVSGVMWNCKIMPVKMVGGGSFTISYPFGGYNWDFSTTAFPSDVADAIDYAVNNGAHVINLSYGFLDMGEPRNQVALRVPLLNEAILNAYNNNVVVVASMGNEYNSGNPTNYPAAFLDVIAVGNTNNSNPPSRYSNSSTGPHICVSAPGDAIISTTRGNSTGPKTGTSMSAPVVSGVAGLIISQGLDRNFNLTNDDVRHILERTAADIGSVGFDNETGYGIVDAYAALQLLNQPNVLYHYNSIGGTSVKTQTFSQWILLSNRWGLAAGTYYSVDQYKITKHVTFDIPFCSTPQVWMRERESKSLSYGNPNSGRPYSIITNVSNTGFDLEYAAYYVRTNTLGQTINKWIPETPALTNVAYTAVGVPNLAAGAYISGPSIVCSSGATFTINNFPPVNSIVWTPGPGLTISSGQNTASCTFSASGNANSWVKVTIVLLSGENFTFQNNIWAGAPVISGISGPTSTPNNTQLTYSAILESSLSAPTDYKWTLNPLNGNYLYEQGTSAGVSFYNPGRYELGIQAKNACSGSGYGPIYSIAIYVYGTYGLAISPNPATNEATIKLVAENTEAPVALIEWDYEIYDSMQALKEKKTKLKTTETKISTSNWEDGVYVVRAIVGGKIFSEKLLVKH